VTPKLTLTTLTAPGDLPRGTAVFPHQPDPTGRCPKCESNRIVTRNAPRVMTRGGLTVTVTAPERGCAACGTGFSDAVGDAVAEESFRRQIKAAVALVDDAVLEAEITDRARRRAEAAEAARQQLEATHLPNVEAYLRLVPAHDLDTCTDGWLANYSSRTCRRCQLLHIRRSGYWPAWFRVTFDVTAQPTSSKFAATGPAPAEVVRSLRKHADRLGRLGTLGDPAQVVAAMLDAANVIDR
jgi:hypothetical protein